MATDIPLNPYEDWAQQDRLHSDPKLPGKTRTYLHPCYVEFKIEIKNNGKIDVDATKRLISEFKTEAASMNAERGAGFFLLDELALNMLQRLEAALDKGPNFVERFRRFFIFREGDFAYCHAKWFEVLNVSASFPATAEFIAGAETEGDGEAAFETTFLGPPNPDQPVLTGIIDDFFGFANERFCFFEDDRLRTRFKRLWIQTTPNSFTNITDQERTPIFSGPTLDETDINLLFDAFESGNHTHEQSVYDNVYPDGQMPIIGNARRAYLGNHSEICAVAEQADPPDQWQAFADLFQENGGFNYMEFEELEGSFLEQAIVTLRSGSGTDTLIKEPDIRKTTNFNYTHGTHMLDCAAGFPPDHEEAKKRPILAVQLPPLATGDTTGVRLEHAMIAGLQRMINWADDWPGGPASIVINLSFVLNAGPKNGEGFVEKEFKRLIDLRIGQNPDKPTETTLVLPAGNTYRAKLSGRMDIPNKGDSKFVDWRLLPADQSSNYLEIWYEKSASVKVEVETPSGENWVIDETAATVDYIVNGVTKGRAYFSDKRSGLKNITLALLPTLNHDSSERTTAAGAYKIKITNVGDEDPKLTLDVQRDDTPRNYKEIGFQSYLDDEFAYELDEETGVRNLPNNKSIVTRIGTLSSMATEDIAPRKAKGLLMVGGAFDRGVPLGPVTIYSGSGPARAGMRPVLSSVSDETRNTSGRLASGTFSGSTAAIAGTSVATALVTRQLVGDSRDFGEPDWTAVADDKNRLGDYTLAYKELPGRPARRMRE